MKHEYARSLVARTVARLVIPACVCGLSLSALGCDPGHETTSGTGGSSGGDAMGCAAGKVEALFHAKDGDGAGSLALDATRVFFVGWNSATNRLDLQWIPKEGGAATKIVEVPDFYLLTMDDANLFWVTADPYASVEKSAIFTVPKAGGAVKTLATHLPLIRSLAVDADSLYWTDPKQRRVISMPKDGSAPPSLLGGVLDYNEEDDNHVTIVVDKDRLFWTDGGTSGILSMLKGGGAVTKVEAVVDSVHFSFDGARFYWVNNDGRGVPFAVSMPREGGALTRVTPLNGWSSALAANSSCLYWADQGDRTVVARSKAGGAPGTVAAVKNSDAVVVADDSGVYWADSTARTIFRLVP
jgi:hypothetical protein